MAIQTVPGLTGFQYGRVSSMDKRALGKLTDSNHLQSFHSSEPADYDKKVISLYTQSQLYSNDFLDMINKSTPYYINSNSDSWKWQIQVPYKFPKFIDVPTQTQDLLKPGIDRQEFSMVIDSNEFSMHSVISVGSRQYGPRFYVVKDPINYAGGFLYTFTLVTDNPTVDFVDRKFLQVGIELEIIDVVIGEFDQELGGLARLGEKITMFESLGSAYGKEHTITKWADQTTMKDSSGQALDILVYSPQRRGQLPITRNDVKWEPFIEFLMRKEMLELKVKRMIWNVPGTVNSGGSKGEVKKVSAGLYHRMRRNGNHVPYNRGEFSSNLLRSVFGDLFYRRVDVKDRRVKMYTNEAGFDVFQQALKQDALNSGLTFFTNVNGADTGSATTSSSQNHLTYGFAFDAMVSRESGRIELCHLKELDLPQSNLEFGQNKKSTPVFMIFDVSPMSDGSMVNNIREVRIEGAPSMTWGYVNGRQHHLGFAKSQGMDSANMFPGYKLWMEDRCDIFIEDLSRTVLIEEIPQF